MKYILDEDTSYQRRGDTGIIVEDGILIDVGMDVVDLVVPDGVTELADFCLSRHENLLRVQLPNSLIKIGRNAFDNCCRLVTVEVPDSIQIIGSMAFANCTALSTITIGQGLRELGATAFYNCTQLDSVYYTGDLVDWLRINIPYHDFTFLFSSSKSPVKLYIKNKLVTDISIPANINFSTIFRDYKYLSSVTFDAGRQIVPEGAFCGCKNLTSLKLSNTITTIRFHAFDNCGITSLVIPGSVQSIDPYAFYHCTKLKSITFNTGLKKLGKHSFAYCSHLNNVVLPQGLETIDDSAFSWCRNLEHISIPSSVKTIAAYIFYNCIKLENNGVVEYTGTKQQFSQIKLDSDWSHGTHNLTIRCTDGDILVKE